MTTTNWADYDDGRGHGLVRAPGARFIVLEGLDGAGTTTQATHLAGWLAEHGQDVLQTFEPSDGPIGRLIRTTLCQEPEAPDPQTLPWMFAADRADHLARYIEPALATGRTVVCDRYIPSSLAYQSIERPLTTIAQLNEGFRIPDLCVYLQVPVAVALARIGGRGASPELFESRTRLQRVADRYDAVFDTLIAQGWPVSVLDGSPSEDAVQQAIRALVEPLAATRAERR